MQPLPLLSLCFSLCPISKCESDRATAEDVFLPLDVEHNCSLPSGQSTEGLVLQLVNLRRGGGAAGAQREDCQLFSVCRSSSSC